MLDLVDVASCFSLCLVNLPFLKVKLESEALLFCPNRFRLHLHESSW